MFDTEVAKTSLLKVNKTEMCVSTILLASPKIVLLILFSVQSEDIVTDAHCSDLLWRKGRLAQLLGIQRCTKKNDSYGYLQEARNK